MTYDNIRRNCQELTGDIPPCQRRYLENSAICWRKRRESWRHHEQKWILELPSLQSSFRPNNLTEKAVRILSDLLEAVCSGDIAVCLLPSIQSPESVRICGGVRLAAVPRGIKDEEEHPLWCTVYQIKSWFINKSYDILRVISADLQITGQNLRFLRQCRKTTLSYFACSSGTVLTRFWQYCTISENRSAKVLMFTCQVTNLPINKFNKSQYVHSYQQSNKHGVITLAAHWIWRPMMHVQTLVSYSAMYRVVFP